MISIFANDTLGPNIKEIGIIENIIWKSLPYFEDSLKKIKEIKNIYIADNYSEYLFNKLLKNYKITILSK